jgi:hypothetical protein
VKALPSFCGSHMNGATNPFLAPATAGRLFAVLLPLIIIWRQVSIKREAVDFQKSSSSLPHGLLTTKQVEPTPTQSNRLLVSGGRRSLGQPSDPAIYYSSRGVGFLHLQLPPTEVQTPEQFHIQIGGIAFAMSALHTRISCFPFSDVDYNFQRYRHVIVMAHTEYRTPRK